MAPTVCTDLSTPTGSQGDDGWPTGSPVTDRSDEPAPPPLAGGRRSLEIQVGPDRSWADDAHASDEHGPQPWQGGKMRPVEDGTDTTQTIATHLVARAG